jgi:hypothetical protein
VCYGGNICGLDVLWCGGVVVSSGFVLEEMEERAELLKRLRENTKARIGSWGSQTKEVWREVTCSN